MSPEVGDGRPRSAGALLRAAREKQGLHIAALAASIKVSPRKLEALEADRYDELAGATFTRALAHSVCRALRIDPAPVLAQLPQAQGTELDHVAGSLNTPFRDRPSRDDGSAAVVAQRWLVGLALVLLLAAVVTYFAPAQWWRGEAAKPATTTAATVVTAAPQPVAPAASPVLAAPTPTAAASASSAVASSAPAAAASAQVEVTHLAPAATIASAAVSGMLQLSTTDGSWVEVRDGQGRVLLSRTVQRGETVGIDGHLPLRLTIGNAGATSVRMRGQPVDLATVTRDNVARIELR